VNVTLFEDGIFADTIMLKGGNMELE